MLQSVHIFLLQLLTAACGRLCCKSLFAPLIANFSSCRRGFRVNMWGTSSPGDKLTGDFGNKPDATSISDRGLFRLSGGKFVTRRFQTFTTQSTNRTSRLLLRMSVHWGEAVMPTSRGFHAAKTRTSHKPGRNPAAQQSPWRSAVCYPFGRKREGGSWQ